MLTQRKAPAAVCIGELLSLKKRPPDDAAGAITATFKFNLNFTWKHWMIKWENGRRILICFFLIKVWMDKM